MGIALNIKAWQDVNFFSVFINFLTTHFYERGGGMKRNTSLWTRPEADFNEALDLQTEHS